MLKTPVTETAAAVAQSNCLSLPKRRHVQDTRMESGFHAAEKEVPDPGTKAISTVPRKRTTKEVSHYLILLEVKENKEHK